MSLSSVVKVLRYALPVAVAAACAGVIEITKPPTKTEPDDPIPADCQPTNCLIFEPGKITPWRRVYQRGSGPSPSTDLFARLDPQAIKRTLIAAIGIPSPSFDEGRFADYVVRQFRKIGVGASIDDSLERFRKLPIDQQRKLSDDGKNPPRSGNVVAYIPPTNPDLPSFQLSFHLDTVPDPDLTVHERDGRLYSDGKTILGGDDKAGFAIIYEVVKLIQQEQIPHGGIYITGLTAEEAGGYGAELLAPEWKGGDIGFVVDAARTDEIYIAGPDIYVGSLVMTQPATPEPAAAAIEERFSLAIEGATQHPAFSSKAINAIGLGVEILKEMKTHACGTVGGNNDIQAIFRFQGGALKEGTSFERPEIVENGNKVPVVARLDFRIRGSSPEVVQAYKERLLTTAKELAQQASQGNKGGATARIHFIPEMMGEAPLPENASAMIAESLMRIDARYDNHPGGDPELLFQINSLLPASHQEASGVWQLRSANPNKTEPARSRWEKAVEQVAKTWNGKGTLELKGGGKRLTGYKLDSNDPVIAMILGGYQLAGLQPPRLGATFGGSNVNPLVTGGGRKSIILVGTGDDFLHTEKENWDIADGERAARIVLGAILEASRYQRVER